MKILFVSSECAPFSKSGGLADVAFSLPPALKEAGDEIAIITPLYKCVRDKHGDELTKVKDVSVTLGANTYPCALYTGDRDGVKVWFVEYDPFFDRPKLYGYDDDALRFAFFSRAVVDLMPELDFMPDIVHCNDWETALVIIYLKDGQFWRKDLEGVHTVYTIHNIAYQGQFSSDMLTDTFALDPGWYKGGLGYEYEGRHDINLMMGAMLVADAVSTVSPTYARELHYPEYGMGLQGVVDMTAYKLHGILNGIDPAHYDPSIDPRIPANYSVIDMDGKAVCKESIQKKFGIAVEPKWPLLCSVARLVEQKGIELIREILPKLMAMGVQIIIFGQGEQKYIDYFEEMRRQWPDQLGFSSDYSEQVAAEVFAGADMYLMPSRFEPCGLSQMMAMRYGTVPIVHEVGGLKDSVRPYSDFDGIGDGFSFSSYQGKDLLLAIREAVKLYYGDETMFQTLVNRCMTKDFSWVKSAEVYNRMYTNVLGPDAIDDDDLTFQEAFEELKNVYTKLYKGNKKKHLLDFPEGFRRVYQMQITGKGSGIFNIVFEKGKFTMDPNQYHGADAYVAASFENLIGMANGTVSSDKLFMNGQLKVDGNIAKGAELRTFFTPL